MLPGTAYAFLQFNLRDPASYSRPHPIFGDRDVRRAIAMSIDRNALVRSVFDTFAVVPVGPTTRAYPTTDPGISQIALDTARARVVLDSLGWLRQGADGPRAKNGKPLSFSIIIPTGRPSARPAGTLMAG